MNYSGGRFFQVLFLMLVVSCNPRSVDSNEENGRTTDAVIFAEEDSLGKALRIHTTSDSSLLEQLLISFPDAQQEYWHYLSLLGDSALLRSEAGIFQTMQVRDSLANELQPLVDLMNESDLWEVYDSLEMDLNDIGITCIVVESFLTGFGPAPMLEPQIRKTGSQALAAYNRFLNAESESLMGEYPYSDLSSILEMVRAGEALKKLPDNRYYPLIQARFRKALVTFCDFHFVKSTDQDQSAAMLTGVGTSPYPFLSETRTYQQYVSEGENSPYRKVIAGVLSIASSIDFDADTVYVLQSEVFDNEEIALKKQYQYLDQGKGMVHLLRVTDQQGKVIFVLAYRFFSSLPAAKEVLQHRPADLPPLTLKPYFLRNDALRTNS